MTSSLESSLSRMDQALAQLEIAVAHRLEIERRRGDLETELQIMQDDRARLAVELDGAMARLNRVEAVTSEIGRRVQRAAGAVRDVLSSAAQARLEQESV